MSLQQLVEQYVPDGTASATTHPISGSKDKAKQLTYPASFLLPFILIFCHASQNDPCPMLLDQTSSVLHVKPAV